MNSNRQLTLVILALGIALTAIVWSEIRVAQVQQPEPETVVYTDRPEYQVTPPGLACDPVRNFELDILDYSHNVTVEPTSSPVYRYKTNLDAEPPVHVHIVSIQGGSGRVVVSETEMPVWLVLLSQLPSIWHIERTSGALVERIVANQSVSELRISDTPGAPARSLLERVLGAQADTIPLPDIRVLPRSRCLPFLRRFQAFDDRRRFIPALAGLRNWLGHPEMSFQSLDNPSYFERPFRVPFEEPEVSVEKLAAVAKLAEPPSSAATAQPPRPEERLDAQFERYADMPRRDDVRAETFDDPDELLASLESYRDKGLIPSSMPESSPGGRGLDVSGWYSLGDYRNAYTKRVPEGVTEDACDGGRKHEFLIVDGTDASNVVHCAWGKQLYFLRGGDDRVDDSWEDDIIYAGPGDDVIEAGWGNDLLFFNYGWGRDTVEKTCTRAAYRPQDSSGSTKVAWSRDWPDKNFLVFGKSISRSDIVRVKDKLVHKETGDSITLKDDCFNVVFWE